MDEWTKWTKWTNNEEAPACPRHRHTPVLAIALNSADGTISLIDSETYQVTGKAPVCKEPHHLMPTPDDKS
jgi:hypothetical protein